uniref:Uncharacterized protein n=1 Tax=Chromera velia CCMP2878 TaxID=1169474 RepID=A0A0G4H853_9ALVE|eukprot:Cvel_5855.t1-p1 / transcript=Cvel_5855.t1 / gene=Cvel_5855 / organism=Chromera_velia_CCMP2878 / gene_product=hypothetical protein / transcript_product=hypothetical protein / location=Cvel_scaffold278:65866-71815(-) / protein_length=531 / sequence_SO=supercontig / SO=protein_coding / is_pseudo=false
MFRPLLALFAGALSLSLSVAQNGGARDPTGPRHHRDCPEPRQVKADAKYFRSENERRWHSFCPDSFQLSEIFCLNSENSLTRVELWSPYNVITSRKDVVSVFPYLQDDEELSVYALTGAIGGKSNGQVVRFVYRFKGLFHGALGFHRKTRTADAEGEWAVVGMNACRFNGQGLPAELSVDPPRISWNADIWLQVCDDPENEPCKASKLASLTCEADEETNVRGMLLPGERPKRKRRKRENGRGLGGQGDLLGHIVAGERERRPRRRDGGAVYESEAGGEDMYWELPNDEAGSGWDENSQEDEAGGASTALPAAELVRRRGFDFSEDSLRFLFDYEEELSKMKKVNKNWLGKLGRGFDWWGFDAAGRSALWLFIEPDYRVVDWDQASEPERRVIVEFYDKAMKMEGPYGALAAFMSFLMSENSVGEIIALHMGKDRYLLARPKQEAIFGYKNYAWRRCPTSDLSAYRRKAPTIEYLEKGDPGFAPSSLVPSPVRFPHRARNGPHYRPFKRQRVRRKERQRRKRSPSPDPDMM